MGCMGRGRDRLQAGQASLDRYAGADIMEIPSSLDRRDANGAVQKGFTSSAAGIILYLLANWSYTTAVFTDPGSPLDDRTKTGTAGYSHLPTHESAEYTSFTVKSTGEMRFCKKCQTKKPDRTHHCSSCRRCVLKMDHHCPWLAACLGLRNYKPFLLFLIYTSLFCWICFAVSGSWVWNGVLSNVHMDQALMPVSTIMLSVISGIIGLVLSGFTLWHIWLAAKGRTTIEHLEKTRYLSPIRRAMKYQLENRTYVDQEHPNYGQQLREIHANVLPGVTRPEEGESRMSVSPAHDSLRRSYRDLEQERERDRYAEYLDEMDSERLPHAFDLGWRRNLRHVFGEKSLLWAFPICNTTGDGWRWEASPEWVAARDRIAREREAQASAERSAGWGVEDPDAGLANRMASTVPAGTLRESGPTKYVTTSTGVAKVPISGRRSPFKANQILGRDPGMYADGPIAMNGSAAVRDGRREDDVGAADNDPYDASSDEERERSPFLQQRPGRWARQTTVGHPETGVSRETAGWNDVPEEMASAGRRRSQASSTNRRKKDDGWTDWEPQ